MNIDWDGLPVQKMIHGHWLAALLYQLPRMSFM